MALVEEVVLGVVLVGALVVMQVPVEVQVEEVDLAVVVVQEEGLEQVEVLAED